MICSALFVNLNQSFELSRAAAIYSIAFCFFRTTFKIDACSLRNGAWIHETADRNSLRSIQFPCWSIISRQTPYKSYTCPVPEDSRTLLHYEQSFAGDRWSARILPIAVVRIDSAWRRANLPGRLPGDLGRRLIRHPVEVAVERVGMLRHSRASLLIIDKKRKRPRWGKRVETRRASGKRKRKGEREERKKERDKTRKNLARVFGLRRMRGKN